MRLRQNYLGSHRDLAEKYRAILDSILTFGEDELVEGLKAFIEAIVNENVSLVISRQLLSEVGTTLVQLEDSVSKAVSHFTLEVVQPRVISFEDQVGAIRQHLADIYEREQNWCQAAKVLVGIPLETGQKQYSVDYKLETYLKIARYVFNIVNDSVISMIYYTQAVPGGRGPCAGRGLHQQSCTASNTNKE